MKNLAIFTAIFSIFSYNAHAFTFLNLRSGMTEAQVQAAAPFGYELRMMSGPFTGSGGLIKGDDVFATLSFCKGHLVSVIRMLDPDIEWIPKVQRGIYEHGQPIISVRNEAWTGPGGGDVSSLNLKWLLQGEEYHLSTSPEGRDGTGALRYHRSASEGYSIRTTDCYHETKW